MCRDAHDSCCGFPLTFIKQPASSINSLAVEDDQKVLQSLKTLLARSNPDQVEKLRKRLRLILDDEKIGVVDAAAAAAKGGAKKPEKGQLGEGEEEEGVIDPLWWTQSQYKDAEPMTEEEREAAQ